MIAYKKRIMQTFIDVLKERIATISAAMENAQAAANAEEKSSAGDKYQTSRAMSHLEKDMHAGQLAATLTELTHLLIVNCSVIYQTICTGSLVKCGNTSFFIAAGIGKLLFEGEVIYILSPAAPLAKSLFNKRKGEKILFNKKVLVIRNIF